MNDNPDKKEALEREAVGNAAKMREALRRCANYLDVDDAGLCKDECDALREVMQSALSAPPRNCDRFAGELDAQLAFLKEVWLIFVTKDTMLERDKFENWTEKMKSIYAKWLYAAKGE